jgi:hypothetical protein
MIGRLRIALLNIRESACEVGHDDGYIRAMERLLAL